jgi:hypothetical protein
MLRSDEVPLEGELLCEHCGYGLSGLTPDRPCPECGNPAADSLSHDGREMPAWETHPLTAANFLATTTDILLHPKGFFRRLRTRQAGSRPRVFAFLHQWISSYLLAISAALHLLNTNAFPFVRSVPDITSLLLFALLGGTAMTPAIFALAFATRALASRLTTFEARLHGYRLPSVAVRKSLDYHAAAMLPVAAVTLLLTATFAALRLAHIAHYGHLVPYLYTLCIYVVVAAAYLFKTYWDAMRSVMWANR